MNGKKITVLRKRMLAWFLVMVMALTTVWPSVPARAEGAGEEAEVSAEPQNEGTEPEVQSNAIVAEAVESEIEVSPGETAFLEVAIVSGGTDGLIYSWYDKNGLLEQTTDPWYEFTPTEADQNIECDISDGTSDDWVVVFFHVTLENHLQVTPVQLGKKAKIGEEVTFEVIATADNMDVVQYQWSEDGKVIEGETGSSYTFTATGKRYVNCNVSDGTNHSWSCTFTVTIDNGFGIRIKGGHTSTYNVGVGETARIEVEPYGDDLEGVTYQWYGDYVDYRTYVELAGETKNYIEFKGTKDTKYACKAMDKYENTVISVFTVKVNNRFTVSPSYQNVILKPHEKKELKAEVSALDLSMVTYQWSYDDGSGWQEIEGETKDTLAIDADDAKSNYLCTVKDGYGGEKKAMFNVSVNNAFSAWLTYPAMRLAPGETETLTVGMSGEDLSLVTFQWSKDGTEIEGATQSSLLITEYGTYGCFIQDGYGYAREVSTTIKYENHLSAWVTKSVVSGAPGEQLTLEAKASADDPDTIRYRWVKYENGYETDLGQSDSTLTVTVDRVVGYKCYVTDIYNSDEFCLNMSIKVENHFAATPEQAVVEIAPGENATLKVLVSADHADRLSYAWQYEGGYDITGATTDTLVCSAGTYICVVNDGYGNTQSVRFKVAVNNHLKAWAVQSDLLAEYGQPVTMEVGISCDEQYGMFYRWEMAVSRAGYGGQTIDYWRLVSMGGNTLQIGNVTGYYMYRCTVSDGYGGYQTVDFSIGVDNHLIARPVQKEITASVGEKVRLEVQTSADDLTDVTYIWYKVPTEEAYMITAIQDANGSAYEIDSLEKSAEYQCVVKDRFGNTRCVNFKVVIDNHLVATEVSKEVFVGYGETAVLEASVSADDASQINYVWMNCATGATVAQGTGVSKCNVENVTKHSQYFCYVKDQYGNSQKLTFEVGVENHLSVEAVDQTVYNVPVGGKATIRVKVTGDDFENSVISCARNLNGTYYDVSYTPMDENGIISFEAANVTDSQIYVVSAQDKYQTQRQLTIYVRPDNAFVAEPAMEGSAFADADGNCVVRAREGEDVTLKLNVSATNDDLLRITWKEYEYYGMDNLVFVRNVENVGDELTITDARTDMLAEAYVTDYYGNSTRVRFLIKLMGDPGTIWSASASFSGSMALNFYCEIPEYVLTDAGAYVTLTKGTNQPEKFMLSKAKNMAVSGHSTKRFTISVNAKEIRDKMVLRLYDGEGYEVPLVSGSGVNYELNGCAMSILEYCDMVIQKSTDSKMIALAKAVKDYGTAAQLYFGYQSTGLSVSNRVKNLDKQVLIDGFAAEKTGTFPSGVVGASISLELLSDNTLRVYFEYAEGVGAGRFAYYVDGKKKTIIRTTAGKCYLEITGIAAKELDTVHTFTVTNGKKTMEFKVSALTYARSLCMSGTKNKPINLGKALYLYNQAAKAYFNK